MSSHKRLLPLSNLSPKAAYFWEKSASLVKKVDPTVRSSLIYLGSSLFIDGITGKVKIGIEEFKEDIITTCHRPPSVEEYLA